MRKLRVAKVGHLDAGDLELHRNAFIVPLVIFALKIRKANNNYS